MDKLWPTSRNWYAGSYGGRWTDLIGCPYESGTYSGFGDLAGGGKKPRGIKRLFSSGKRLLGRTLSTVLSPGGAAEAVMPGITTGGIPWMPILLAGGAIVAVMVLKKRRS